MAKRCLEEFNPWPAFVDIFASVILVMLLYLLITIVNIAYYSQFKFKVAYTGTVSTEGLIVTQDPQEMDTKEVKQEIKQEEQEKIDVVIKKKVQIDEGNFESAGKDLRKFYIDETTKQTTVAQDDYLLVNFGDSGIKIENPSIIKIKEFITKIKQKYPQHIIKISASDPTNQVSSTMKRRISLARTLNAKSLIRQLKYKIKDVRIDLMGSSKMKIVNENAYGYLIIRAEKK